MKRTVRYTVLVLIAIINSLVITTSLYAVLPYNELHQLNMSNGLVTSLLVSIRIKIVLCGLDPVMG
jgi:hypothetical protein